MEKNKWAVMDNNGIIHDGPEEEMREAFQVMINDWNGLTGLGTERRILRDKWQIQWVGDLLLVEIHLRFN
jgi:hypothetical protein